MMRKKHLIQQNNTLNETRDSDKKQKTKVAVQYIKEERLLQTPTDRNMSPDDVNVQDDIEVEYLDDHASVEYIEDPNEKEELEEDTFYPNAIHCLLDLYKTKYETLPNGNEITPSLVSEIWRDIAKDMQESFFEFNEHQIQQKYVSLRSQYFAIQSKEDIENFDYFEELHDIYRDPVRSNIVKGLKVLPDSITFSKDELLIQPLPLEINKEHLHSFKSEEIVHKEHEFIDMVEKELQAMEEGVHSEGNNNIVESSEIEVGEKVSEMNGSSTVDTTKKLEQNDKLKRTRNSTTNSNEQPPLRKQKTTEEDSEIKEEHTASTSFLTEPTTKEFTLLQYNEQQERRHREKLSLLEKSLKIQERALEQQNMLLQELIKRLPS